MCGFVVVVVVGGGGGGCIYLLSEYKFHEVSDLSRLFATVFSGPQTGSGTQ